MKRLKCAYTAIKVYIQIPQKELCLCCFLTVACTINVIVASFKVLVSHLLILLEDKEKLGSPMAARRKSYEKYHLSTPIAPKLHLSMDRRFSFLENFNSPFSSSL